MEAFVVLPVTRQAPVGPHRPRNQHAPAAAAPQQQNRPPSHPRKGAAARLSVSEQGEEHSRPHPADTDRARFGQARPGGGLPHQRNLGLFSVDPDCVDNNSEENLRGFIKTRGSLVPGQEFVFWWTGDIHSLQDDGPSKHLFKFEGYNIGRMMRVDGGWRMLTREVGLYKDPTTGAILDSWSNPDSGTSHDVVHVWNDPVNQQFMLHNEPDGSRDFKVPTTASGDDLFWHAEIFLRYPSPLPRAEFPDKSASDLYQSAELFQFYTKRQDLERDLPSAPCQISWVRVGQWLPWMDMGDRPGKLVYHCRGKKLDNGFASLPDHVRHYIHLKSPEYAEAPYDFTQPNETSWSYYKKLLDQKGAPRADGTVARRQPESSEAPFTASPKDPGTLRSFTGEELAEHNGTADGRSILLSILGKVYDVSSGIRHYGLGETYNCLTGKDCTRDFLQGALPRVGGGARQDSKTVAVDLKNLTDQQEKDVENWQEFFSKQYPQVGVFPAWRDTINLHWAWN